MDHALTNDQFRILRNARDGGAVPTCLFRPKSYLLDVEVLLHGKFITPRIAGFDLTSLGAECLRSVSAAPADGRR
jgi:hypothetical protein